MTVGAPFGDLFVAPGAPFVTLLGALLRLSRPICDLCVTSGAPFVDLFATSGTVTSAAPTCDLVVTAWAPLYALP
jgi:hypothetical protein